MTDQVPTTSKKPAAAAKKTGRIDRTLIGLNVLIQLGIVLAIVLMVNTISYRRFTRWDLSHNQNYKLSDKTKNILQHLEQPVRAIVFFPHAQILTKDLYGLLREYEYASDKKFSVEYVDPYKNLVRATELADKYKFGSSDNIVILDYKGKSKFVNAVDMAEMDNSGAMMGQPPTMRAFKGEEAITSALQSLTDEKENKLYVVTGHGEPALDGEEASFFKAYAERENIKLASLSLNNVDSIPADATGLLLFGPKTDLSERELQLINDYWAQKKGRLMVLLNASVKTPRLAEWLSTQGVTPQNDRVLKVGSGLAMENGQPVLKSNVIIGSPMVTYMPEGRNVVKNLETIQTQMMGATQSLKLDQRRAQMDKVRLTPLIQSGEGFWGEVDYVQGENRNAFFDPKKDAMGPLTIAVAVERGGLEDPRVKVDTSRMIVVGNSNFLTNSGLRVTESGIDFALLSLNWMFNRETVSGIPPKPKAAMTLSLDEAMVRKIYLITLIAIPLVAGVIGLYVTWHRRNRNLLQLTIWLIGTGSFIAGFLWIVYLFITSREAGVSNVNPGAYLIPIAMVAVPLAAFLLHVWKSNATPALAKA